MNARKLLTKRSGHWLVAGAALACFGAACSTGSPAPVAATARTRPLVYRVVYRVESLTDRPTRVSWEELTARRPFEVSNVTYPSRATVGSTPQAGTLTSVDHLFLWRPDGLHALSGRQPAVGTADQALLPVVRAAVDRGLARPGATRVVAGRRCRDYRFLEPPAGPVKRLGSAGHDELCLDADGFVLREAWTLHGRLVLRRTAVTVDLAPAGLDAVLDTSTAQPAPPGVPSVLPATDRDSWLPAPPAPAGFHLATHVRFVFTSFSQPNAPPQVLYTSVVWAFTRRADLIVVEAGQTASLNLPWQASDPSRPARLPLGRAASVIRSDGAELRVALAGGRWVRVRGTVSPDALASYAHRLRRP
ncbi:MAG: hypothetical protein E6G17_04550 [Actinobacteria bacterium]|nr:MAG: hypothetical protein E6G17_04550 [Actinomycetota bacterium]